MNRIYYLLTSLMFLLAVGLLFLPELNSHRENSPEDMLRAMNRPGRFLTADQVAARIIERDPALLLIDVRNSEDYENFALEGALNVPIAKMLDKENEAYLKVQGMDLVFYSNGDIDSEKAWMTAFRAGAQSIFILKGGLNSWTESILKPVKPSPTASAAEQELYDFRRAACLYFKGGVVQMDEAPVIEAAKPVARRVTPKPVVVQPHPQEEDVDGGC